MIRLTENIKSDLDRWDKVGYIIISASISATETLPKLDADGNEIPGEIETDENGEPIRYLTDQYIHSQEVIYGDGKGMDNGYRTNALKKEIQHSGFSFKRVWGVYMGDSEDSFMIFPLKMINGKMEKVPFEELYEFGKKLVGEFTQYSVHVHKPGTGHGEVTNDNYKGEEDDHFENTRPSTEEDDFRTATVNPKKPSALNHSFSTDYIDSETNHKLIDRSLLESLFANIYEKAYHENVCAGTGAGSISSFAPEHMRGLYVTGSGGGYGLQTDGGKVDKDSTPRPQKIKYAKDCKVKDGESYLMKETELNSLFEKILSEANG